MKQFGFILLLCAFAHISMSQSVKLIAVGASANAYRGDLSNSLDKWSSAFHVGLKLKPDKKFNSTINLGIGFVTGENPNYIFDNGETPAPSPNRFFRSSIFMLNYELNYNLLKWKNFTFYVSQGIGFFRFNPQDEFFDDFQDQPQTRAPNETFSNLTVMLPTQLGVMYLFPNGFGLNIKAGLLNTLSDYLDNISDWGVKSGSDNIFATRFSFLIPLKLGSTSKTDQ